MTKTDAYLVVSRNGERRGFDEGWNLNEFRYGDDLPTEPGVYERVPGFTGSEIVLDECGPFILSGIRTGLLFISPTCTAGRVRLEQDKLGLGIVPLTGESSLARHGTASSNVSGTPLHKAPIGTRFDIREPRDTWRKLL